MRNYMFYLKHNQNTINNRMKQYIYSSIIIFISANVLKFLQEYIKIDQNKNRFTFIVLLFVISINFLIFIPNIITILIG